MSGVDFQRLEQMAQQAQMPLMQRQQQPPMMPQMPMQQVQPQFMPQPVMPQQQQQQQGPFNLSQAIMAMQRQPMPRVQNPFFGGAIPMNFGLPQASQIPAGFQVRQFTPGPFMREPVNVVQNIPTSIYDYNDYAAGGGIGDEGGFGGFNDIETGYDYSDDVIGDANLG